MWRLLLIIVWIAAASVIYNEQQTPRAVFGVRVSIGSNSQINHYVCFIDNGRALTHKRLCDEQTFIKIVSGHWPSIYNPQRINYFDENHVGCGVGKDSITLKDVPYCEPFDSLWKIRFTTYPFQHHAEAGWSNKLHKPSATQEKYIYDRYGVGSVDANYFLDTSFWLLLRDVQDTMWIANYRALK